MNKVVINLPQQPNLRDFVVNGIVYTVRYRDACNSWERVVMELLTKLNLQQLEGDPQ